jgi:phage terminase small subunit
MARLTEKQERFCNEWVIDFNGQYAAIRAGYPAQSAHVVGCKLLKRANVIARIAEIRAETSIKTGISLERTLEQLGKMAHVDPAEMYNPVTGELLPITQMPEHVRQSIVSIEQEEIKVDGMVLGVVKKIKLAPREKAVDMIMKHLGGYAADNKQKAPMFEIVVDIVEDSDEPPAGTEVPDDENDEI